MAAFYHRTKSDKKEKKKEPSFHYNDGQGIVSVWLWIFILILTAIPIINLISLLTLAFFVQNKNLQNYGRASLVVIVIPTTFFWLLRYLS
ncbi:hypothetical protein [Pontibacillus sp. HMF3514]|uniref:hypothetical protein n=1 Tax=Pontibacillus sp. HMF3514 TaxID=2692425 RepID=UPI0013204651|nr:hypothetical protein [Pontibacillus sp. HMF3514]QHE52604.1 hypothetical protein GS400_11420 [Pontibacillus sp. HMF3514]